MTGTGYLNNVTRPAIRIVEGTSRIGLKYSQGYYFWTGNVNRHEHMSYYISKIKSLPDC